VVLLVHINYSHTSGINKYSGTETRLRYKFVPLTKLLFYPETLGCARHVRYGFLRPR